MVQKRDLPHMTLACKLTLASCPGSAVCNLIVDNGLPSLNGLSCFVNLKWDSALIAKVNARANFSSQ